MNRERAHQYIRSVEREAQALAERPDGPLASSEPLVDRMAFRAEWANAMGRFALLVAAHDAGELPSDLVSALAALSARLAALLPLLNRLRLRAPSDADLARLAAASAA